MNNKRILIIGQCTLHWGRMEYGNIGNYYIVKAMFEEMRKVFPNVDLATTMQFSKEFCEKYQIETLPMEIYYDFVKDDNLEKAQIEYEAVINRKKCNSRYIDEVRKSDLIIDFSGDIWGENANLLGNDRFAVGCYKDLVAQVLRPTVMLAGSPGPFGGKNLELAKKAYEGFDMVVNREPVSTRLLRDEGFDISKTINCACPSFLFEEESSQSIEEILKDRMFAQTDKIQIGMMLCGWNFKRGPFDIWPREDTEYINFLIMLKNLMEHYNSHIYLLSHCNGFDIPPQLFRLKQGRDFPIMQQLADILKENGYDEKVTLLDGVYTPGETRKIISCFDMLISGRMHGAVAGLSQGVPTVIIDYGHEPKAHKLCGFAEVAGVKDYIANPNSERDLIDKTEKCLQYRNDISIALKAKIKLIKENSKVQFEKLSEYIS